AARTNELDAGKRRKIIGGGEGLGCGWACQGRVRVPGAGWRSGLASTHPAPPGVRAAAMTMCPGTGLLSQKIERGLAAGSCRRGERTRDLAALPSSRPLRRLV